MSYSKEPHLEPVVSPGGNASLAAGEPGVLGHSIRQVEQLGLARLRKNTEGRKVFLSRLTSSMGATFLAVQPRVCQTRSTEEAVETGRFVFF